MSTSIGLWKKAIKFNYENWRSLILIAPFLVIPVFCDILYSILIWQKFKTDQILPFQAVLKALKTLPKHVSSKFSYEGLALLVGWFPILGWIIALELRMRWAMVSNIYTFEGENIHVRCKEVLRELPTSLCVRTLYTVPSLLGFGFMVIMTILVSFTLSSIFYFLFLIILYILAFPLSATVNTHLYLAREKKYLNVHQSKIITRNNLPEKLKCPNCDILLELTPDEQITGEFVCPVCESHIANNDFLGKED